MLANHTEWQWDCVELSQCSTNTQPIYIHLQQTSCKKVWSQQTLVLALVCLCWVDLEDGVVAGDPRPDVLGEELCLSCLSVTAIEKNHITHFITRLNNQTYMRQIKSPHEIKVVAVDTYNNIWVILDEAIDHSTWNKKHDYWKQWIHVSST